MSLDIESRRVRETIAGLGHDGDEPICAYIYDLENLRRHAQSMRDALPPRCQLYYAVKANAEPAVLDTLAPLVDGFEVASGGELRWLRQQQAASPLLFGGPGKLDSELALAVALPDCSLHVESLGELERLARIAAGVGKRVSIYLRMNMVVPGIADTRLMMGGKPTPFGMDEDTLPQALACLRQSPWMHLEGFHFHLMSHQLDAGMQLQLVRAYLDIVARWRREHAVEVQILNAGGGFGVDYADPVRSFNWLRFCDGLRQLLAGRDNDPILRFEPGRYVTAACGYYVMEVLDIKRNHGEWFAIARGGTHHFRTPPAQGHDHPFFVLRGAATPTIEHQHVTVVGQLCTPKDVLARLQPVQALAPGDRVVFPLAGAYAWNISHQQFLMHPPPRMVFLAAEKAA